MILFLIGLILGALFGFFLAALLAAGREPDRKDAAPTAHSGEE